MSKPSIVAGVIGVVAVLALAGWWIADSQSGSTSQNQRPTPTQTTSPSASASASRTQAPKTSQTAVPPRTNERTIAIRRSGFSPASITVPFGVRVEWINQDSVQHQIKSETFTSSILDKNDMYSISFTRKGTFSYTCGQHPEMKGQIIVE